MNAPQQNYQSSWLEIEAPRYTSYPSAQHFSAEVTNEVYATWLHALAPASSVTAYVHVPFCQELCWFCGCHTKMVKQQEPITNYVNLLTQEIALVRNHVSAKGHLQNIHFGGGSPSLLRAVDLEKILSALTSCFATSIPHEWAIELDPRTTTRDKIKDYATLGFNRVSLGIQDFDPEVQKAINRIQPYQQVSAVVEALRDAQFQGINCDLIYGLPQQTPQRLQATLEKTLLLDPSRIALFSYAHVPRMKKHQRLIALEDLPSTQDKLALYNLARSYLESNGYIAIGIDHFAKADDPLALAMKNKTMVRNFQGYCTDDADALIGFGSSSIGQLPQGYAQNSADMVAYRDMIQQGKLPVTRGWQNKPQDRYRKAVIDHIMCYMSVDLDEVADAFGKAHHGFDIELQKLRQMESMNIVEVRDNALHVIAPHPMAARVVASVFDEYFTLALGRYSKVA